VKNALLFGAPPTLTVTPSPLNFSAPSGPVNGTLTVKNDSAVTLSVTAATISLNPTEFALVTPPTFPVALAPAASTTLTVRFTPSMNGTRNGELTLTSDGAVTTHTIPLKGVAGPPAIGIAYASFTFADTAVGSSSAPLAKNIGNIGFNPLTISSITLGGSHPGDFSLSLPTFPAVVAPGTNLSISATFTPTAVGSRSATITIVSDDPYVPSKVIPFYGQGLAGDAGVVDAAADTRPADSAPIDSTAPDTTAADTTVADTAVADTTVVDTTVADTTVADTTVVDSSVADTTVVDSAVEDTNVEDTGIHEDTSTARADTATSEDADPIPAAAPASDEGCGCTTAGRSADRGAGLALLGLLLAAGWRRK
jgi:MYXO-CTERM domain-containing protein